MVENQHPDTKLKEKALFIKVWEKWKAVHHNILEDNIILYKYEINITPSGIYQKQGGNVIITAFTMTLMKLNILLMVYFFLILNIQLHSWKMCL